jgi:lysophospholipase
MCSRYFQISPMEIASFDPSLSAGMNLTYAGTHLSNGKAVNGSACVTSFDQAGFVMGSSASLFNVRWFLFSIHV